MEKSQELEIPLSPLLSVVALRDRRGASFSEDGERLWTTAANQPSPGEEDLSPIVRVGRTMWHTARVSGSRPGRGKGRGKLTWDMSEF